MSLKDRLKDPGALLCPGVYDGLSALLAQQAGFEAVYLSGASLAYTQLGRSDVGLTTYSEVVEALRRITERIQVPVLVDADTGFGNALNVQRTVRGMEQAGAAMIQLEDQSFPKRCGHLDGKALISASEMVGKIRAATDARRTESTLILARTDALAVEGWEAAMERAEAYLQAGADALFIEALRSEEQLQQAAGRFAGRIPLLANMVEGVSNGYSKKLEIVGVGNRAQVKGKTLVVSAGYSHPVEVVPPEGITFAVENNTNVTVSGTDKELVGNEAAKIRAIRPPEPYKGKGIKYEGERILRKAGKSGKK